MHDEIIENYFNLAPNAPEFVLFIRLVRGGGTWEIYAYEKFS